MLRTQIHFVRKFVKNHYLDYLTHIMNLPYHHTFGGSAAVHSYSWSTSAWTVASPGWLALKVLMGVLSQVNAAALIEYPAIPASHFCTRFAPVLAQPQHIILLVRYCLIVGWACSFRDLSWRVCGASCGAQHLSRCDHRPRHAWHLCC